MGGPMGMMGPGWGPGHDNMMPGVYVCAVVMLGWRHAGLAGHTQQQHRHCCWWQCCQSDVWLHAPCSCVCSASASDNDSDSARSSCRTGLRKPFALHAACICRARHDGRSWHDGSTRHDGRTHGCRWGNGAEVPHPCSCLLLQPLLHPLAVCLAPAPEACVPLQGAHQL